MDQFTEIDLQELIGIGEYRQWLEYQLLEARPDGLWFPRDREAALKAMPPEHEIRHKDEEGLRAGQLISEHPRNNFNLPVLPFPFTVADFRAFALHRRFDLRPTWIYVHPDDSEFLDEDGIAATVERHQPTASLFAALFPRWATGNGRQALDQEDISLHTIVSPGGGTTTVLATSEQLGAMAAERATRQAQGDFTIEQAAQAIGEQHGLNVKALLHDMLAAARSGDLRVINQATGMARRPGETIREFYDWVRPADVNEWAAAGGATWRWRSADDEHQSTAGQVSVDPGPSDQTNEMDANLAPHECMATPTPTPSESIGATLSTGEIANAFGGLIFDTQEKPSAGNRKSQWTGPGRSNTTWPFFLAASRQASRLPPVCSRPCRASTTGVMR